MFKETKLIDYLRIIRDELEVRETTSKELLWKQFVSTIKETGLKSQINLEDTLGSFEDDDDFAEHVPAVAVRAGGIFSAHVATSSGHRSSSGGTARSDQIDGRSEELRGAPRKKKTIKHLVWYFMLTYSVVS